MRYVGGKVRQAKTIAQFILEAKEADSIYVEPFLGGASVASIVCPHFKEARLYDIVQDLVMFWNAIQDGWIPPTVVTKAMYDSLKDKEPSALRAWVGFAASFKGIWWGGYGPQSPGRDYLAESLRASLRKKEGLEGAKIVCSSYQNVKIDSNCIVYCDPPYHGTKEYKASGGNFDHEEFWNIMEEWHNLGATVFVSEFIAPSGWRPLYTKARHSTLDSKKTKSHTEKLFVHV